MIHVVCFALLKQTNKKKEVPTNDRGQQTGGSERGLRAVSGDQRYQCVSIRGRERKKSLQGKSLPGGGPLLQYCCQSGGTTLKQTVGQGEKR